MNIPASDARTEVVSMIQKGEVERLRQWLASDPGRATARIVDRGGTSRTLLHVVADWPGHFPRGAETVAVLIAAGADVNAPVIHSRPELSPETALHWAASCDDVGVLDALLDGGADIEAPGAIFTGGSAMSDAVVFAQWKAARRLLERGARTTIWQAAALGLLEEVQAFCASSTGSSEEITNAFWNACRGGHQPTAAYLLDQGADLNWIGHDHKTPLEMAQESGVEELITWLRERGAKSRNDMVH